MNSFSFYNQGLRDVVLSHLDSSNALSVRPDYEINDAQEFLRNNESIIALRKSGVFFTGDVLANECADLISSDALHGLRVLDPCCGAGNLLIAVSKRLDVKLTLKDTLMFWNEILHGFDLYENFVEATKLRLIIEAVRRGVSLDGMSLDSYIGLFTNIICIDALNYSFDRNDFTHIIMNPPYSLSEINCYNHWRSGKVNLAAVFVDYYVNNVSEGTKIVAILPDVLRSGTRYTIWRDHMQASLSAEIISKGRFDAKTDVDVFIMSGTVIKNPEKISWNCSNTGEDIGRVSDYFSVSIGKVVPYRDVYIGNKCQYLFPKNMVNWSEIDSGDLKDYIEHQSEPVIPPFIVIKRTSSPSDKSRAVAQLIKGVVPVYVENHLIVVKPFQNSVEHCRALLSHLKSTEVDDFLNDYIRCRHLTVKSIKMIPFGME